VPLPPFPAGCLAVVGLAAEAALLPEGLPFICSGGRTERLGQLLAERPLPAAILSFGIAGGLAPGLACGALVAADAVIEDGAALACDAGWAAAWAACSGARLGPVAASDSVMGSAAAKVALHRRTGALTVDMESGVAARFARAAGIPFAALRAIADPSGDALVPSAALGLNPDGTPAPARVLAALLRRPQDLPGLLRIALQSRRALARLRLAVARASA
jgi:hopanoid-associated phosphorylase